MARVKIDTDVLTRCSASMNDKVSQFADLNARLQQLTGSIGATWTGEASTEYTGMMTAYLGVAEKLRQALEAIQGYISQSNQRFEQLDARCAAQIRSSY